MVARRCKCYFHELCFIEVVIQLRKFEQKTFLLLRNFTSNFACGLSLTRNGPKLSFIWISTLEVFYLILWVKSAIGKIRYPASYMFRDRSQCYSPGEWCRARCWLTCRASATGSDFLPGAKRAGDSADPVTCSLTHGLSWGPGNFCAAILFFKIYRVILGVCSPNCIYTSACVLARRCKSYFHELCITQWVIPLTKFEQKTFLFLRNFTSNFACGLPLTRNGPKLSLIWISKWEVFFRNLWGKSAIDSIWSPPSYCRLGYAPGGNDRDGIVAVRLLLTWTHFEGRRTDW